MSGAGGQLRKLQFELCLEPTLAHWATHTTVWTKNIHLGSFVPMKSRFQSANDFLQKIIFRKTHQDRELILIRTGWILFSEAKCTSKNAIIWMAILKSILRCIKEQKAFVEFPELAGWLVGIGSSLKHYKLLQGPGMHSG